MIYRCVLKSLFHILFFILPLQMFVACGPGNLSDAEANLLLMAGLQGNGQPSSSACGPSNSSPVYFTTGQAASVVIGQAGFTTQASGISASAFNKPWGNPVMANGYLYLPDYNNNRVLGFNAFPSTSGVAADFVLGATDFTTSGSISSAENLSVYEDQLFVTNYGSGQIEVFNPLPTTTTPASNYFITGVSEANIGFFDPEMAYAACGKMAMSDADHNRVLLWNSVPTGDGEQPDLVLGQTDFTGSTANQGFANPTAATMNYPMGIWTDGTRLLVADNGSNRVLIWNSWPTRSDQSADLVLGQVDFSGSLWNYDMSSISASTFYFPTSVYVNGDQIFVADNNNNRVLIWNSWPTQNGQAADMVLGQIDFTSRLQNQGTATSPGDNTLSAPTGVFLSGTTLIVTDSSNNRYMFFEGSN